MKTINICLIIIFLILSNVNLLSQSDSVYTWSYQLENDAWRDWDSINNVWMKEVYFPCLKENNLKMSCASCVYIYIDAGFIIDSVGKLTDIRFIKENICTNKASDQLIQCFFNYFKELIFPKSLRKKKIKAKFGTGLSC